MILGPGRTRTSEILEKADRGRPQTKKILEKGDWGGPRTKKIFKTRTGADRGPVRYKKRGQRLMNIKGK